MTNIEWRYFQIGHEPGDYYRCSPYDTVGIDQVQLWDGEQWKASALPNMAWLLDDALGSGAWIREVLDRAEVPGHDRAGTAMTNGRDFPCMTRQVIAEHLIPTTPGDQP